MASNNHPNQHIMEVLVGLFATVVFAGVFMFTVIVDQEMVFSDKPYIVVKFQDVMGLRKGDHVVIRGMSIGKVKDLILANNRVEVHAVLDQPVDLREDYEITIVPTSMLGGRQMDVFEGASVVAHEGPILGLTPTALMKEATELIHRVRQKVEEGGIIENISQVSGDLAVITKDLRAGKGTMGRLLKDDSLYESMNAISTRLNEGKGTLGKLLQDDSVYANLDQISSDLRTISSRLAGGKGTMGRLLSDDDQLYKDLSATVASLKQISGQIEKSEGSLGLLVNDDRLYEEATQVMGEIRAAVDDFRETAPVITFSSILFGVF